MRKIFASVGLVAVGAASLHAAYAPGLSRMEASKSWSISAALRGFYDDNYIAAPSSDPEDYSSFGFEVSPSLSLNFPLDQTFVGFSYTYSLKYYADRTDDQVAPDGTTNDADPMDQSHEAKLKFEHKFSERYVVSLDNSFVYTQEPEVVSGGYGPNGAPQSRYWARDQADVLRNRLLVKGEAQVTEVIGVEGTYQNIWYNYMQEGPASRSALLDRFEHLFDLAGLYRVRPETSALLGYQFGMTRYTDDEAIYEYNYVDTTVVPPVNFTTTGPNSDSRDNNAHYFYVGVRQVVSPTIRGEVRIGGQYTAYDDLPDPQHDWNPYAELAGTYEYRPGSYAQAGFKHVRNATDVVAPVASSYDPTLGYYTDFTLDQESSMVYASISHRITPQLTGTLLGQWQYSVFNGGSADGDVDNLYLVGFNLDYKFNPNWSAELGYNWDRLDSDEAIRSFSRNRVYLGVRATY